MFCVKCGNQVAENTKFCQKCGAKLAVGEAMPQTSDAFTMGANADNIPVKSEAVIHSYSDNESLVNTKIKVYCNKQSVGEIGRNESITIPISTDSLLEFKYMFAMRTAKISVKQGKRSEFKLEFNKFTGKLCVFDLNSNKAIEQIEEMKKGSEKKILLLFVGFAILWLIRIIWSYLAN